MIDDKTPNLNLPLPSAANDLSDDVNRLRSALSTLDSAVAGKASASALADKADASAVATALQGKADLVEGKVPVEQLPPQTPPIANTDALSEGTTNLYFTAARARTAQQPATAGSLGVVKVGSGLTVGEDGTVSVSGGSGGGTGLPAFNELVITPTSNGQTVFAPSGGYVAGQIELYLNGVLLIGNGDDYTASNGTSFTLTVGVNTTDTLLLRRWAYLPEANAVNKTGDTMTGKLAGTVVSMANFLDKTVTNATATGTVTLDLAQGDVFDLTLSGITTVALTGIPTLSNEMLGFVVRVTQGATAYGLTWFSGITWLTTGGTAPDAPAANKTIEYVFTTKNGTVFQGRKGAAT